MGFKCWEGVWVGQRPMCREGVRRIYAHRQTAWSHACGFRAQEDHVVWLAPSCRKPIDETLTLRHCTGCSVLFLEPPTTSS